MTGKYSPTNSPECQHHRAVEEVPPKKLAPQEEPEQQDDFVAYTGPALIFLCVVAFAVLSPGLAFIALICLVIFSPCVILHELAHLMVARRAGMQVEEFSLGFGQRVWSRYWRGIRWSVKMLPLGGSVEIAGMTVEDVEQRGIDPAKAFIYKSPWTRARVVLAGVTANVALAWAGLTVALIAMAGTGAPVRFYLEAPLRALLMLRELLTLGLESLRQAVFDWGSSDVGSILSLPRGFAVSAEESMNQGVSLVAFFLLFFAALNLSLALFNLLPLYPLDGYHGAAALVDQVRRGIARVRQAPFAPLSTWRMRWFARGSGTALALFVGSIFVRDIVKMM